MSQSARLAAAEIALRRAAAAGSGLCAPLVSALPIGSAAISTLVRPFQPENICASDAASARLAQREIDLGEGPSWQALASGRPVLLPDVRRAAEGWPTLMKALVLTGVRAVYAFPLRVGYLDIGAMDLYSEVPDAMDSEDVATAAELADLVAGHILRRATAALDSTDDPEHEVPLARREVHQATGILIGRFRVPAGDALLILRAHAFTLGRPVAEVAADLVAGRIELPR